MPSKLFGRPPSSRADIASVPGVLGPLYLIAPGILSKRAVLRELDTPEHVYILSPVSLAAWAGSWYTLKYRGRVLESEPLAIRAFYCTMPFPVRQALSPGPE